MKKNTLISVGISVLILSVSLAVFFREPSVERSPEKLTVVTSFYPLYFFASEIGGDSVDVMNLTPVGSEPHDYELTAQDMVAIKESDLLVLNGGGLEAWGNDVLKNTGEDVRIIIAGEGLMTEAMEKEGADVIDPHIWLSPARAIRMSKVILQGFVDVDPVNAAQYEENARVLEQRLLELDAAYRDGLSDCDRRDIITSHAAFGYLAAEYDLKQVSIAGLSPEEEPSSKRLAELSVLAKESGVTHIFFESLASPKLSETLAREIGAQTLVLNPLEGLTNDEIAEGKDYFTEMEANLQAIRTALRCEAL